MLTLWGQRLRLCDGIDRRAFLKVGSATGLLSLSEFLRLQTQATGAEGRKPPRARKSVIMVYLLGGPSQLDTYDPKPSAPAEYRGEFQPIKTNVGGIEISELFPKQAAMMDKLAIVRSLSAASPNPHSDAEVMTGYKLDVAARGKHPSIGSVISKLRSTGASGVPPFVAMRKMSFPTPTPSPDWEYYRQPGFLGGAHRPFMPTGPGMADLQLPASTNMGRLNDRRALLAGFDQLRRSFDASGTMAAMDQFQQQAYGILTSSALATALDLSKEDPRVVERYSLPGGSKNSGFADTYKTGTQLLLARRLVEAGVGFVEVSLGYWDTHGPAHVLGFPHLRNLLCPTLDTALTALIEDLHQRGLEKDVVVLVWGEFGRSPRINKDAGRDHWLPAMSAAITGGGLKTGQVIGSTDSRAENPKDNPYGISNMLSTVYRAIGIDPETLFYTDDNRPMRLLPDSRPITELL